MKTKKCKICLEEKRCDNFHKQSRSKDGYRSICKECRSQKRKQYYKENREKILLKGKKQRQSASHKEKRKKYYQKNKEQILQRHKTRYLSNKSQILNKQKLYYNANKENISLSKKIKYNENKIEISNKRRLDREENILKHLLWKAKERARKENIVFDLSTKDLSLETMCPILNKKFIIGKRKVTNFSRTIDKIIPELGYTPGNVVIVSYMANKIKSDASILDVKKLLNFLLELEKYRKNNSKSSWMDYCSSVDLDENASFQGKKYLIDNARARAKNRNLSFSIKKADIFVPEQCPALGLTLRKNKNRCPARNSPTIDRIDNSKGYVVDNIAIVSNRANTMKGNYNIQQISKVYTGYKVLISSRISTIENLTVKANFSKEKTKQIIENLYSL